MRKSIQHLNEYICDDCGINKYDVTQRSTFNLKCIQCSPYCEYCQPQDQQLIQKWNPYSYLTNKCLKVKDNLNEIHLESLYGIAKYCNEITTNCYSTSNVFLNLNCSETRNIFISSLLNQQQYEEMHFDIDYLNFMAVYVSSVQFLFTSDIDSSCYSFQNTELKFQNNLKFSVYSLTTTQVEINSLDSYQFLDITLHFINLNVILLYNLRLIIQNKNSYILCEQLEKDY